MIQLTASNVRLGARPANKEEAIRLVGRLLVDAGYIAPGYVESMLSREHEANTYLGNGIAIPHGMPKDRELIHNTGIAILQAPDGVEWNPGELVRLVVGIAARSDEHLGILANLTDVLDDPATAQQLAHTADPSDITTALNRARDGQGLPGKAAAPAVEAWPGAPYADVQLAGSLGLHARPATFFVDVANQFQSEIRVQQAGKVANGKAMASLLKLGAEGGTALRIEARGPDAEAAVRALRDAVVSGLGEEESAAASAPAAAVGAAGTMWAPNPGTRSVTGVAASPGLAIGPLFHYRQDRLIVVDAPQDPNQAWQQLAEALAVAKAQLSNIYEEVKQRSGPNDAFIFRAHQALLDDPDLLAEVRGLLHGSHSAAWAWNQAVESRAAEVGKLGVPRLAARAADLHDVGQRVLRVLVGEQGSARLSAGGGVETPPPLHSSTVEQPVIIAAEDLTPSDTASLDPKRTLGLVTAGGGPTSHTAIIARALDIPAVVGVGGSLLEQSNGIMCILDGHAGKLYLEPSEADLASARQAQQDLAGRRDQEYETRYQPAMLTDGARVEIAANIGKASEAAQAVDAGAEGVGLLRTEFLFLGRPAPPTEEEQFAAYSEMTAALNGLPLIIRTLDIGGDKQVPYLSLPAETNPFLGVRGIRLCLRRPDLFEPQLRAIYRAAATGLVRIMYPMVATLEEWRAARNEAERVRRALGAPEVEMGIMVEVPSTVLLAREFAREVDFFSVGTNDLTQYVLAMDRQHPSLARQADGLHPAVLRMIEGVVGAADAEGKWVGVCGGIAGDPRGAVILTGLGVKELSMSIPSIAAVKAHLRRISLAGAQACARRALACATADEVRALRLP